MDKRFRKALWKSILLNVLAGVVGMLPFTFLNSDQSIGWGIMLIAIAFLSLLTQLIVALVYINNPDKKPVGQGMLLSVGIFLLMGLALCGPLWFGGI